MAWFAGGAAIPPTPPWAGGDHQGVKNSVPKHPYGPIRVD